MKQAQFDKRVRDISMVFKESGNRGNPVVFLIHGGGLSGWMWRPQIEALEQQYCIVTPILDGHGEESGIVFESISKSAKEIIRFINENFDGKVFALCGLSVGAQIVVEILARENDIAEKAVIESALLHPSRLMAAAVKPVLALSYPLIRKRWFAKLQAKFTYLPNNMFEDYFCDSRKMSKESLLNIAVDNARYAVPVNLGNTSADVLILCGEKEYGIMKESAELLHRNIKNSTLKMIPDCGHGYSLKSPDGYIELLQRHFTKESSKQREDT